MSTTRGYWHSNLGFLLAAIGSAIGLGNVWRFSYMAHQYGGGAFLVPYIVALLVAGLPIMLLEYGVGHLEKASSPLSFRRIGRHYEWLGWWMPVVAMFGIMLYYAVIVGWCVNYLFLAVSLGWGADPQGFFFNDFLQLSDSADNLGSFRMPILLATGFVWFLCWLICFRDVRHGIERASKIVMPALFILTLIMVGWTLTLEGATDAIMHNYLSADWSRINIFAADPLLRNMAIKTWVAAFGQIFFTLSLGFGIMITYASYLPDKINIGQNAVITCLVNCAYSLVAGLAVFGIVGFMAQSQGVPFAEAIKGGPQLAFVVYPKAISMLPSLNVLFGLMFFLILVIAGLTSGVSLIEAFTCSFTDKFAWPRKKVVTMLCAAGFLGSLIFTTQGGLYVLDIADHFITNYGLVVGGLLECLLVGWVLKSVVLRRHFAESGSKIPFIWDICIKFITPLILIILVYFAVQVDLAENYGGYSSGQLQLFGGGALLLCLGMALAFALAPWHPDKVKRRHQPEEDDLLV
ncbi:MAG: sodium-dependent transporter [Deltaproteobacteria bacterium]|jgi:NSS family neurotransmitter:Na+ symporter|nr:sodium-dependent transporter [Deltaproteobacteria bacterium]